MFELKIASNYPNSYWFEYKNPTVSGVVFSQCKPIDNHEDFIFSLKSKVSQENLFSYDFYFSDGPFFISPRLASLLSNNSNIMADVQLIDADVYVNKTNYHEYKIMNIIREVACIDMEKSESQPILSYLPNGPRKYNKIIFKEKISENLSIARCQEYKSAIIVSDKFKDFILNNNVKGIDLLNTKHQ